MARHPPRPLRLCGHYGLRAREMYTLRWSATVRYEDTPQSRRTPRPREAIGATASPPQHESAGASPIWVKAEGSFGSLDAVVHEPHQHKQANTRAHTRSHTRSHSRTHARTARPPARTCCGTGTSAIKPDTMELPSPSCSNATSGALCTRCNSASFWSGGNMFIPFSKVEVDVELQVPLERGQLVGSHRGELRRESPHLDLFVA